MATNALVLANVKRDFSMSDGVACAVNCCELTGNDGPLTPVPATGELGGLVGELGDYQGN